MPSSLLKEKTVGLAIFSYKAPHTLNETLASYKRTGLLELFDDVCIFFVGTTSRDQSVANQYGIRSISTGEELGVRGGISCMVANMQTDYLLMVEHDCQIWNNATPEKLKNHLTEALGVLERDSADMVRLRHSWIRKTNVNAAAIYSYFYQIDQLSSSWKHAEHLSDAAPWVKWTRRMLNPVRAKRWIGRAVYVEENPHLKFPKYIHKDGNIFIVDSSVFHWTNQPSLTSRKFLMNIMKQISPLLSLGDQSSRHEFERQINNSHWRKAHYRIGVARGIFI